MCAIIDHDARSPIHPNYQGSCQFGSSYNPRWGDNPLHQVQDQPYQQYQPSSSLQPAIDVALRPFIEEQRELHSMIQRQADQMISIAETLVCLASPPPQNNPHTFQSSSSEDLSSQPLPSPKGSLNAIALNSKDTSSQPSPKPKSNHNDICLMKFTFGFDDDQEDEIVELEDSKEVKEEECTSSDKRVELKPNEPQGKTFIEDPILTPFHIEVCEIDTTPLGGSLSSLLKFHGLISDEILRSVAILAHAW
ncbi:hypothetical protein PIB30_073883 [Stylosanthes scabra]|uniref:Uncharacterized protein n=1 Tax=Stylosanthes scabra TaxID=79078 RepID=A0ABU6YPW4_9FABA|nr:hypothetical protein [Stylosanthes scabra]